MEKRKNKKIKPPVGSYVSTLTDEQLLSLQKRRSLWLLVGHALFVVSLFIPQVCMDFLVRYVWLETIYFVLMFALIVVLVWAGVFNFRGGKIGRAVSEKVVPKRGLDGLLTFTVFELQFVLALMWYIMQLALIIWKFDVGGLVITLIAACVTVSAFLVRLTTARAFRGHTVYTPPAAPELPNVQLPDEADDFYAEAPEENAQAERQQKQDEPETEAEA